MSFRKLSRKEKENLYIRKMTKLQKHWGNPIDDSWDFSDWTDKELDESLNNVIGQLRFEMPFAYVNKAIVFIFLIFVALGIIGLLVFGIRQII